MIFKIDKINIMFTSAQRIEMIEKAANALKQNRQDLKVLCPLNNNNKCSLYEYRPLRCRLYGIQDQLKEAHILTLLKELSKNVFVALSGTFWQNDNFEFSVAQTVSGKYVQTYFNLLTSGKTS